MQNGKVTFFHIRPEGSKCVIGFVEDYEEISLKERERDGHE